MEPRHGSADHDELLAQLGWMRTLARRLVRDPDVADDVLQRSCLLALQRPAEVAPSGARLRAWLAAVVRRVAGHRRRAEARRDVREQRAAAPEALPATVDLAARREILRRLVESVTTLDEPGFSTIVRRYYEGLSTLEIAAQDGVSPGVVRQRLQRARARLRERLEASLDPRWLPALALFSPHSGGLAPAVPSHPVVRGLLMAERATRPVVWKAAAAVLAVALGAGVWYALEGTRRAESAVPVAAVPASRLPSADGPALPELPAARVQPTPMPAVSASPVTEPVATSEPAAAPVSSEAAWNRLWATADSTIRGDVRFDDVLDTTDVLITLAEASLAVESTAITSDPATPLVLLDNQGIGRATFFWVGEQSGQDISSKVYRFAIDLDTQDGHYTGLPQRQPDHTTMKISFAIGRDGSAISCGTLVQNQPAMTPELQAHMAGRGRQTVGGDFSTVGGSTQWKPVTCEVKVDPATGKPEQSFTFSSGKGETRDGAISDPRVAVIAQRLSALASAGR